MRLKVRSISFVLALAAISGALQASAGESTLAERIGSDLQLIHAGEFEKLPPLDMGRFWARLASDYEQAGEFAKSESAYNRTLELLDKAPNAILEYAATLDNLGLLYLVEGNFDAAEVCRERSYAIREKTGDVLAIARGKWMLAEIDVAKKRFKEAQKRASEAYAAMVAQNDPFVSERVTTLTLLSFASCKNNKCALGVEVGREAKRQAIAELPVDHFLLGQALIALGYAEWKTGLKDEAGEDLREGVRILRERVTPGHSFLLAALKIYSDYLKDVHRAAEADEIAKEEKALRSKPTLTCANCTVSVYGLFGR
jgi:tetratricopeptide (TPR) repeat protein